MLRSLASLLILLAFFSAQVAREGMRDRVTFWKRFGDNIATLTDLDKLLDDCPTEVYWKVSDELSASAGARKLAAELRTFAATRPSFSLHDFPMPPVLQSLGVGSAASLPSSAGDNDVDVAEAAAASSHAVGDE